MLLVRVSGLPARIHYPCVWRWGWAGSGNSSAPAAVPVTALKLLLRDGADPDSARGDGLTALHLASREGYPEATAVLLDAGATVDAKSIQSPRSIFLLCVLGYLVLASYAVARPAVESLFLEAYSSSALPSVWIAATVALSSTRLRLAPASSE